MADDLGDSKVTLDVVPDASGFGPKLEAQLKPQLAKIGRNAGKQLASATAEGFKPSPRQLAANMRSSLTEASKTAQTSAQSAGKRLGRSIASGVKDGFGDPLSAPLRELPKRNLPETEKGGDELGGAFAKAFRKRLEASLANLPKAEIDATTDPAQRKLDELRRRLEALSARTVGVDVSDREATAKLEELKAELRDLALQSPNVQVRADVAAALAELGEVETAANELDGRDVGVRLSTNSRSVLRDLRTVSLALAALTAPVTIPLAISGAGLLAAGGAAVGAGLGGTALAAIPGIKRITEALSAQKSAQDQVASSARNAGAAIQSQAAATIQGRLRALQMASAQEALQVAQQQATQAHQQALQQVQQAEQSLADAQRNARAAQEALNEARRQAARDLVDLANQVRDAELGERSAVLSVAEARQTLTEQTQKTAQAEAAVAAARQGLATAQASAAKTAADPNASLAQKKAAESAVAAARAQLTTAQQAAKEEELAQKRARLAVDQAIQALKEQRIQLQRLRADKKAADKAGIDGDRNVVAARQQVIAANQEVQRQEEALRDARANVARVDADSARQVRDAQRAITEQLLQNKLATLQSAKAADSASGATDKWRLALGKLTGPERDLLDHITRFRAKYDDWAKSLERPIYRAFGTWLDTIGDNFGLLTPAVEGSSDALTTLGTEAEKSLTGKFWTSFFKMIGKQSQTDTYHLGRSVGNVAKGVGGIIKNFLPYAPGFFKWLDRITGRFADWSTGKKGKQDFGEFMNTARQNWPTVRDILKDLWQITKNLTSALGQMSPSALKGIENILSLVGKLSPQELQALIAIGGGAYLGGKLKGGGKTGKAGKSGLGGLGLGTILGGLGWITGLPSRGRENWNKAANGKEGVGGAEANLGKDIGGGALVGAGAGFAIGGPVGALVGGGIGAVGGAVGHGIGFMQGFFSSSYWKNAKRMIGDYWSTITTNLKTQWDRAWTYVTSRPEAAWRALTGWFTKTFVVGVRHWFSSARSGITQPWDSGWTYVRTRPAAIWRNVSGWFAKQFVPGVRSKITGAKDWITRRWRESWNYVTTQPRKIWHDVSGWFTKTFLTGVRSKFTTAKTWITRRWRDGLDYVNTQPRRTWSDLSSWFSKKFIPGLGDAFRRGVHSISTQWNKVKQVAKTPINFVIGTVYGRGIKGMWDRVADWLHLGKKWHAPTIKPLAKGGVLRQYADDGHENHVAQIAKAGEYRLWAEDETGGEAYIPLSPRKRARSTQILSTVADEFGYGLTPMADGGIIRRFADGGLWGWVDKTFSSVASKIVNFGKSALNVLSDPAGWLKTQANQITSRYIAKIPGPDSPYGAAGAKVSENILDKVADFAERVVGLFGGGGGAAMKALKAAETREGVPYVYGGTDWQHGMDCSGLTMLSYRKAGISIPRTSEAQWGAVKHIPVKAALPGDLLFTEFRAGGPGHVGFRTQFPIGSAKASFNEPHTGLSAMYRSIGAWTAAGRVPGAHAGGSTAGGRHASPSQAKAYAQSQLPEFGWGGQFGSLDHLWTKESGWRWSAANPSGAYGIPQALPGSKMASAGSDWHDNAYTQIRWGLGYIGDRYGSPAAAWRHSQLHNWYGDGAIRRYAAGGAPPPGSWGWTGENGPELQYFGAPSRVFSREDSERLTAAAGGDGAQTVEYHAHFDGMTRRELQNLTRHEMYRQGVRQAQVARVNRRR